MKRLLIVFFALIAGSVSAQIITTDPAFPSADKPVTITIDVTGTSLHKFPWDNKTNPVWIWITKGGRSAE